MVNAARATLAIAGLICGAFLLGWLVGRGPTVDSPSTSGTRIALDPPLSGRSAGLMTLETYSAAEVGALRDAHTDHKNRAAQLLTWLEQLAQNPVPLSQSAPYDRLAVYHALKYLGDVKYVPAIPFLLREGYERKLQFTNPELTGHFRHDPQLDVAVPAFGSLVRIGPPSAGPIVSEFVKVWETEAQGNSEYYKLRGFLWLLRSEELIGTALIRINDRLGKANWVPGSRAEIDALHFLKTTLTEKLSRR